MEPGDFTQLSPVNTPASAVLVGDYAAYWLDTLPSRLKPRTVKSYRELYRLHLAPSFNGIGLGELKRAQVKALLLDKHRQGPSRNTVRLIGSCLSALCSEAIDDGLLTVSPVAALGRWLRGSAGSSAMLLAAPGPSGPSPAGKLRAASPPRASSIRATIRCS